MAINLRVNFASSSNFCYGRWRNTPTMHVRTLLADSEKRIQAFETKCPRKLLLISDVEHKTNDWVRSKINFLVGPQEPWRVGDAVIDRENAEWKHQKVDTLPMPYCSQGPPAEKTGS